jgi:oxygen-independent coproporphyrinogen-3 oxidase
MLPHPAAYIHFPWCVRKCPYCDFNSHPLKDSDDFGAYRFALERDWQSQQRQFDLRDAIETVFLGGGTPSLFAPEHINGALVMLPLADSAEVTMEANPGTTEHSAFADYRDAGVNRLSLGAQSFDDAQLKRLGRIHKAADTLGAFEQARQGGYENINLDLMWGLPEQTASQALADLQTAITLNSEHISWYQLTLEPKTEFYRRPPTLPADETLAEIERLGLELLEANGYVRYEVSAFARDERYCRHNLNYWSFGDYVGIGAGAHGKLSTITDTGLEVRRTRKASQPRLYLQQPEHTDVDTVPLPAMALEFMMNALRLVGGVSKDRFTERTGLPWSDIQPTWQRLHQQGLVEHDRCATTALGLRYLDSVLAEFVV